MTGVATAPGDAVMTHQVHPGVSNAAFGVGLGLLAASNAANARRAHIDSIYRAAAATENYYAATGFATDIGRQAVIERNDLHARGVMPSWYNPNEGRLTIGKIILFLFAGVFVAWFATLVFALGLGSVFGSGHAQSVTDTVVFFGVWAATVVIAIREEIKPIKPSP